MVALREKVRRPTTTKPPRALTHLRRARTFQGQKSTSFQEVFSWFSSLPHLHLNLKPLGQSAIQPRIATHTGWPSSFLSQESGPTEPPATSNHYHHHHQPRSLFPSPSPASLPPPRSWGSLATLKNCLTRSCISRLANLKILKSTFPAARAMAPDHC